MPLVSSGVEHGNLRELALARMKDMGTQVRFLQLKSPVELLFRADVQKAVPAAFSQSFFGLRVRGGGISHFHTEWQKPPQSGGMFDVKYGTSYLQGRHFPFYILTFFFFFHENTFQGCGFCAI